MTYVGVYSQDYRVASGRTKTAIILLIFLAALVNSMVGVILAFILLSHKTILASKIRGDRVAMALLVAAVLAFALALIPGETPIWSRMQEAARFLGLAIFAIYITNLPNEILKRIILFFAALISVTAILYIANGSFSIRDASGTVRFSSVFPHSNHLGYACAAILIFLVSSKNTTLWGHSFILGFLPVALGLFLSGSSGAILVCLFGIAASVIFRPGSRFSLMGVMFFSILIVVLYNFDFFSGTIEKFTVLDFELIQRKAMSFNFGGQDSSFAWRLSYWLALLDSHINSGWGHILFGQGGGATLQGRAVFDFMSQDPHNDFLRVFIEFGVVGVLGILGALLVAILRRPLKLVSAIILFGPMLAGNSLVSFPVMLIILLVLKGIANIGNQRHVGPESPGEEQ